MLQIGSMLLNFPRWIFWSPSVHKHGGEGLWNLFGISESLWEAQWLPSSCWQCRLHCFELGCSPSLLVTLCRLAFDNIVRLPGVTPEGMGPREWVKKLLELEGPTFPVSMLSPTGQGQTFQGLICQPCERSQAPEGTKGGWSKPALLLVKCFLIWTQGVSISCVPQIMLSTCVECLGNAALAGLLLCPQLLCWWGFPFSQRAMNRARGGGGHCRWVWEASTGFGSPSGSGWCILPESPSWPWTRVHLHVITPPL